MHAELVELFHRDRDRRTTHAGRHRGDRHTIELAGEGSVLAAEGNLAAAVEVLRDHRRPAGITRHQHVLTDITPPNADVVLLFRYGHRGILAAGAPLTRRLRLEFAGTPKTL